MLSSNSRNEKQIWQSGNTIELLWNSIFHNQFLPVKNIAAILEAATRWSEADCVVCHDVLDPRQHVTHSRFKRWSVQHHSLYGGVFSWLQCGFSGLGHTGVVLPGQYLWRAPLWYPAKNFRYTRTAMAQPWSDGNNDDVPKLGSACAHALDVI